MLRLPALSKHPRSRLTRQAGRLRRPPCFAVVAFAALITPSCSSSATIDTVDRSTKSSDTSITTDEPGGAGTQTTPLEDGERASVAGVVDGDTLDHTNGTRIRLIGIDTPETKDPRKPVECFGREAAARLATLLPAGTEVTLVYDIERLDRYGRTLAYVYRTSDGLFVNAAMVADGYASAFTYPPNVEHAEEFVRLEREAREANRGLWAACRASDAMSTSSTSQGSACDASYPDVCIHPPPPDLDCGDVAERRFTVVGSDPHRFDRDGDGLACES
ncbi:MAG: thermonuclease family protein [Actinobacteria bacterium]|nr:thermonuclease family protein [Actinomycetota bacterium]